MITNAVDLSQPPTSDWEECNPHCKEFDQSYFDADLYECLQCGLAYTKEELEEGKHKEKP